MKTLALIIALTATLAMAGYQNIHTGAKGLPERLGNTERPTFEQCLPIGVRIEPAEPEIAEGYTRTSIRLVEGDGRTGAWEVVDRLTSELDAEAAIAASNAAIEATMPIEQTRSTLYMGNAGPVIQAADGHAYQPVIDPTTKEWLAVPRTGSPWHPDATFTNAVEAAIATNSLHVQRIDAIKDDLDKVELQVVSTNWIDMVLTNIITTTAVWSNAAQRATMIAVKDALQADKANDNNLKIAVRNLKQACEKLRREVK
jgi:hypothetical protein